MREEKQVKSIALLLQNLTVFQRTCKELEQEDYEELARCVKLERAEKNTRLFDCGDPSTELMVVLRGQIGVIYPDSLLMDLIKAGPDARKEGVELVREEIPIEKDEPLKLELASFVEVVREAGQPKVGTELGKSALELALQITELIQQKS